LSRQPKKKTDTLSARILTNTPTSGEFPEFYFGEHFRQTLWVEFVDNEYEKWIGCFQCDYPKLLNEVLVDMENKSAFVVSGGIGYLIDIENRKLKYKTEENPLIESVILTTNPDYFIAGTFYCIYVFDNENLIQEVLADDLVDGIYFKRQVDRKAVGDLASIENQFEFNLDFKLDLDTFELIVDRSAFTKHNDTAKKSKQDEKSLKKKQSIFRQLINKMK
jgi:hypothetical protein